MSSHVTAQEMAAYVDGGTGVDFWALEVHLEKCAGCRDDLAKAAAPSLDPLLSGAHTAIRAQVATGPAPVPRRRVRVLAQRWTVWSLMPWTLTTAVALVAATVLDQAFPLRPSLVLLLAPVAPLSGLAAAWSARADPAWETISGTARFGLELLLGRTLVVLATVVAFLGLTGLYLGRSPVMWLLPCLAFTSATLLLGGFVGVERAALGLGLGWLAVVVAPALVTAQLPVLVGGSSAALIWGLTALGLGAAALLRASDHQQSRGQ
ncbi:hypothetical protein [Kineosporia babensis]|uniref:Zinc-finger domain-containing protein n=1 Tax=Kineosporia babensis TaxID=499548 RepID=A0A9X1NKA7_9ACTN|nr:hypothetical protein [Kineosporia babensis]MCD5315154.1 hypothetical protein [Kineosporia babensis]